MYGAELGYIATYCLFGLTAILLLYWLTTRNHDYWQKMGVPSSKPWPLMGTLPGVFLKPFHEIEKDNYLKYGHIYGYYEGNKPVLSVGDPDLVREILVKDFSIFNTRRVFISNNEIFDKMVSVMKGDDDWKRIRTIITPTFTTGKIKRMMGILKDCSQTVVKNFYAAAKEGKPIDAKLFYGAYSMDVIASSAFSTKIDSHSDPENPFVQHAKKIFQQNLDWKVIFVLFPSLIPVFKITFFPEEVLEFYKQTTIQIIEERKKTGQTRNDCLQLLMDTANEVAEDQKVDLPEKDILTHDVQEDINPHIFKTVTSKNLSMEELVAQCVSFFIAGYDTTASTLAFVSYLLALNPRVQDRLREEVDQVMDLTEGELTYEAIQNMKYLDNIISETLRLYAPLVRLERTADTDYLLGDTAITILKGMVIGIPIHAMHRDPKVYPDPETFNPDRFTPEERAKRHPYCYLPFGAGPRNCVAMRFALMEVKACLVQVIANFIIKTCPQTKIPLDFGMGQVILQPKGIILEMESRKDAQSTE